MQCQTTVASAFFAVERIIEQRETMRCEMHADLMGASGEQTAANQRTIMLRIVMYK